MANKQNQPTINNQNRLLTENDFSKFVMFLEELSWLFKSYSDSDFSKILKYYRDRVVHNVDFTGGVENYVSPNPNKHFLVGVLPRLLTDEKLFSTNEDIAQFSESVMNVVIPRYHKKSRYELIGHIVCQTNNLSDKKLSRLVKALTILISDDEKIQSIIDQKKDSNFGWNFVIQQLIENKENE